MSFCHEVRSGLNDDMERAFSAFGEIRAFGFLLVIGSVGVGELELALSENLEAIVEVGSRSKSLGSKAGTGIVDFRSARFAAKYGWRWWPRQRRSGNR